ncbi:MAG: hypothetical protein H0V82_10060 [Candidatus Protochlamydia sp.]|nr:hypothetical protein [Candidatus Protochlamydia sp.]
MNTQLYTLPSLPIPLLEAALNPETAQYIEPFTDGLITVGLFEDVKKNVQAYRKKNGNKKMILKLDVSYAGTREEALDNIVANIPKLRAILAPEIKTRYFS